PAVTFDGSPGTGAPPATLGGYTMTAFPGDPAADSASVTSAPAPNGTLSFDQTVTHRSDASTFGGGWSNGYTGDAYVSNISATNTLVMTLPANTGAFYFYAESNECGTYNAMATAQDGTTSGPVSVGPVCGSGVAKYFGFYGTGGAKIK